MSAFRSTSWRRATRLVISGALTLGVVAAPALLPPPAAYADSRARRSCAKLVNPVLQSYVPAAGEPWSFESTSRIIVEMRSETNLKNERLAEVVNLMNAEYAEKELVAGFMGMVYAPADSAAAADIVVDVVPVEQITDQTKSAEAYKIDVSATGGVRIYGASETRSCSACAPSRPSCRPTTASFPRARLVDWPNLQERRLFVDCGRKFFSKNWSIRQTDEMAYLKLNTIDMHFSEKTWASALSAKRPASCVPRVPHQGRGSGGFSRRPGCTASRSFRPSTPQAMSTRSLGASRVRVRSPATARRTTTAASM